MKNLLAGTMVSPPICSHKKPPIMEKAALSRLFYNLQMGIDHIPTTLTVWFSGKLMTFFRLM